MGGMTGRNEKCDMRGGGRGERVEFKMQKRWRAVRVDLLSSLKPQQQISTGQTSFFFG